MNKKFFSNLKFAFIAQTVSILFSLIMYLILPKIVGVLNYSYWQLFLFYTNYSGFFHLGLVDGIYLQLGGEEYSKLNYNNIGSQLKLMIVIQIIIAIVFSVIICNVELEYERVFVILFTVIYIILYCVENFLGFVLQAVNLTKKYSIAVIIEKIICLLFLIIFLINRIENFKIYIVLYVLAKVFNLIYLIISSKEIVFSKMESIKRTLKEMKRNISIGSVLMFSGIASTLIIGSGRMIIDGVWGIENFGKVSFSISMINMVLLFIRQISMVLFPALREINDDDRKNVYKFAKSCLVMLLPIVFVLYVPGKIILSGWLPQYIESLKILAVTLPICVFDAKMQILGNTFFKVLRKEKKLLNINLFTMILSCVLSIIMGIFVKSMLGIVVVMVFCIVIRSIISEMVLDDYYEINRKNSVKFIIFEVAITIVFMTVSYKCTNLMTFCIMFMVYLIYLLINKEELFKISKSFFNKSIKEY